MIRDYNAESADKGDNKYVYSFDYDVLHKYMFKSFVGDMVRGGNALELGCFEGEFTKRLKGVFNDITCVEASNNAIQVARTKIPEAKFYNEIFETVKLTSQFDNIFMTHVLEHVDEPVTVLKRVNEEWLSETGRFFLVCPNANAPSRQIAVKMGLITHNSAVTPSEEEHGHRCTYSLDTLERDARLAGLKVVKRQGIFFKALANFQWDQLLQTDIISDEYLDGCYELGQVYPDLCASICLVCERG